MSDEIPETPIPAEKVLAINSLREMIDASVPVIFRAKLEPGNQYYLVRAYYNNNEITNLISVATEIELVDGQFRHSIKEVVDALVVAGVVIDNLRILDADDMIGK